MKVETVTTYTCDLCGNECKAGDGIVRVEVHPGDGRDVGPGHMVGEFSLFLPYRCSGGQVCEPCKLKFLRKYLDAALPLASTKERAE